MHKVVSIQDYTETSFFHWNSPMETHQIGIDVSKKKLNVALLLSPAFSKKKTKVVPNKPEGFESLMGWLRHQVKDQKSFRFIMEATGAYHQALALFLGFTCWSC